MRLNSKAVAVVSCLLVLQVFLFVVLSESESTTSPGPRQHDTDITGGAPHQRNRIDSFIAQTEQYDTIELLEKGLHDPVAADFDIVYDAGLMAEGGPPCILIQVLADRRAARLLDMMKQLPGDEAAARSVDMFQANLKEHLATWDVVIQAWLDDDPPTHPRPIGNNFHALCCTLFLCSQFCTEATIDELITKWTTEADARKETIFSNKSTHVLSQEFMAYGGGDPLFYSNIYIASLQKKGTFSEDDAVALFEQAKLPVPGFSHVPLLAWDAHTTHFDFTHKHRGVPADTARTLIKDVTHIRTWPIQIMYDEDSEAKAVGLFQQMCIPKQADEGGGTPAG